MFSRMQVIRFARRSPRNRRAARVWPLLLLVCLAGCASAPQPLELPAEYALPTSSSVFWRHVDSANRDDWFHLLNTPGEALAWRLRMIDSAHDSIDMETFLWKLDAGGMRVLAHLLAAADRGVRVRILLDDAFTQDNELALEEIDQHPNVAVRIYNPYNYRVRSVAGRAVFNLADFQRVNHRLHNKSLSVDGWAVSVGGRNLASEYFGLSEAYNFRDMEVLTLGASVLAVERHFDKFWNSGWAVPVARLASAPLAADGLEQLRNAIRDALGETVVHSDAELEAAWKALAGQAVHGSALFVSDDPAREDPAADSDEPGQLARYLMSEIGGSREEVTLVTAYLVPTPELLETLRELLQRGVRVRILTNSLSSNNHLSAHAAYQHYVRGLLEAGVELYELRADAQDRNLYMQDPVEGKVLGLHAKFMLLDDDRVFIGSSNLDPRSLKLNTELGLMIDSAALNGKLRDAIAVDFLPRNSWSVQLREDGLAWVAGETVLREPPSATLFQRLEDWFIGLLPIDEQM
ncbi:phospholipase D family protein [Mangrovimicrobium sediminis]|uniref:Phospholipase D family protein n=1 Tax=Mangrovimicrobium sediminis TaxID=2562682 RepID=A0A4Z0M581_9GAMM|nr:phospholipase D family protein [Haliea sp. SAOS-164]TGD74812.1 phospholipase D family protein [Haliea sp. SAOS-164]